MSKAIVWIPLTVGAAEARVSYGVLLRKVLVGDVCGKRLDGHWYVAREDVLRLTARHEHVKLEPGLRR